MSALAPLLAEKIETHVDRGRDVRRRRRRGGRRASTGDLDIKVRLIELDREQHRMHYDVVANGVLWFLHHGMFDRARRPRFDLRFRDAWDAFVAVNQTLHRRGRRDAQPRATIVLVQDYQLTLAAGQLRALRPDLRVVHFTHTPFAGPDDYSVLPTDIADDLCAALASGPAGFHTKRWADVVPPVGAGDARPARLGHRSVRREPRPRRRRARRGRGARPAARAAATSARPTRSATGS